MSPPTAATAAGIVPGLARLPDRGLDVLVAGTVVLWALGASVLYLRVRAGRRELAAVLAEAYFGSSSSLHRFDMSEYGESSGSATLLGAPQGTIGSDRGGVLTNALRTDPYAVYLFDEIEKAERSTMNVFLQMLDAGRLTGRDGITVDATHAIFVFTSNLGAREALADQARGL